MVKTNMKKRIFSIIKFCYGCLIRAFALQEFEDEVAKAPIGAREKRTSEVQQKEVVGVSREDAACSPQDGKAVMPTMDEKDLRQYVRAQELLRDVNGKALDRIFRSGKKRVVRTGEKIATQGDSGEEVFLILEGEVEIVINEHTVDYAHSGECVGEMVLFDPLRRRGATLISKTECLLFVVGVSLLRDEIRRQKPQNPLVYNLAAMVVDRLRKREWLCRPPNARPLVFIGSSVESKKIAEKVEKRIKKSDGVDTELWTAEDMFSLSKGIMEDLEKWISKCDFAVLILSKDDYLKSRGNEYDAPRDNVVFELGYCMGRIGRDRTLFLLENGTSPHETKIPSDINGLTYLPYVDADGPTIDSIEDKIISRIKELGVRK